MAGKTSGFKGPVDVLLATGSSGGTISAVRELSKSGLRVAVISDRWLCPASWSRFTSRSCKGPRERDSRQFLDLLLRMGAACPGQVLLPTSDETAWLYAANAPLLQRHFQLQIPPIETIKCILDKKLLADAATQAGLAVLPTWEPRSLADVVALAPTLIYPILIKPRTHLHRVHNDKGRIAHSPDELIEGFREYVLRENGEAGMSLTADSCLPLLQHFVMLGSDGVRSVSGFIDKTGELFVTRHATKVFQRSEPAGVGVCFESLPDNPDLSAAVHRLCRDLGYFGIFEVEFIHFGGRWAVIDFNPRLFNQAALDAYRGMPLALFAYLDAAGMTAELRKAIAIAREDNQDRTAVFHDSFTLRAILAARFLTRRTSREEITHWRAWKKRNAAHSVDFAAEKADVMPGIVHAISDTILGLRGLRRFLRSTSAIGSPRVPSAIKVSN